MVGIVARAIASIGLASIALMAGPASATTLTLNGVTLTDGGTITGSFSVDLASETFSNVDILVSDSNLPNKTVKFGGSSSDFSCTNCYPLSGNFVGSDVFFFYVEDHFGSYVINLVINAPPVGWPLVGQNDLIPDLFNAGDGSGSFLYIDTGVVSGVSAGSLGDASTPVPEPGSLALLFSALLGLAFVYRRQRA